MKTKQFTNWKMKYRGINTKVRNERHISNFNNLNIIYVNERRRNETCGDINDKNA